jgi:hypothetical protein
MRHKNKSAIEILGSPDDLKFRSCLTLFAQAALDDADRLLFAEALNQFYNGKLSYARVAAVSLTLLRDNFECLLMAIRGQFKHTANSAFGGKADMAIALRNVRL